MPDSNHIKEMADLCRNRAKELAHSRFRISYGIENDEINDMIDSIIQAAILEVAYTQAIVNEGVEEYVKERREKDLRTDEENTKTPPICPNCDCTDAHAECSIGNFEYWRCKGCMSPIKIEISNTDEEIEK